MQKVTPFLSSDGQADEAAQFYVSLLPASWIDRVMRSPVDTPGGAMMTMCKIDIGEVERAADRA